MRSLPADLTTELLKEYNFIRHFFKVTAASTYRWTDCDQDVYFDSNWWTTKTINFDAAQYSLNPQVDSITIEIANVDKVFSDWVLSENIQGKEMKIYRVALDNNLNVVGGVVEADLAILFLGYLDEIKIDRKVARIQVYNHFIKWKTPTPRRLHFPKCPWNFKVAGSECGYVAAETWCDQSWERCLALGNTLNFGGFRWLPDLSQKEIWWGQKAKLWKQK